jgi:hypothetical protein
MIAELMRRTTNDCPHFPVRVGAEKWGQIARRGIMPRPLSAPSSRGCRSAVWPFAFEIMRAREILVLLYQAKLVVQPTRGT